MDNRIYWQYYDSPLGRMRFSSDGKALLSIGFREHTDGMTENTDLPVFRETKKWFDCYFGGACPEFTPELVMNDTAFRLSVWERLKTIPYGETVTYGDIAKAIADEKGIERMSAQAVGNAVGRNPFVIIIPCHRVVAANGKIGGYYYGIDMKKRLLEIEKAFKKKL